MSARARVLLVCLAVTVATGGPGPTSARASAPNDPSFGLQWGDSNTGQSIPTQGVTGKEPLGPPASGTPGADQRALPAWGVTTGSRAVVIAELDTGVEYTHPDLAANIWSNPGGIGGCPKGTHGYNALDNSCEPTDGDTAYEGHGTHVAGIMGAVANNAVGVAGINWQTTILPVKWLESAGAETSSLLPALEWILRVKREGVNIRVVNDSPTFFGTLRSEAVKKAIEALGAEGILFVTAAGNTGNNNDEEAVRRYPCGFHLANELCVTATDNRDALPSWANYGPKTVDLAAPGVSIYSTLRGGKYGYLTGGSMASPQVAGAAALILAQEPSLTATQLRARIVGSVRPDPALAGKVTTGGVLDVCKAIAGCTEPSAPSVATSPATSVTRTTATLNATVNPDGEAVSDCHFDYGLGTGYGSSASCAPQPGSGNAPVAVSAAITGLTANTTYHFRIVATNAKGSSRGADVTFTTPPNPPAPAAVTGAATSVSQTAATLNASVNPNGEAVTDCHFDYGTTTTYGSSAACTPQPGAGASPVSVSATIAGLSANVTYHFRVVASGAGGTSTGADVMFTTPAVPPPGVEAKPASGIAQTAATLNATVNPNGATVGECRFDFGSSVEYGSSAPCAPMPGSGTAPVPVSAAIAALSPSTTYHFRVRAASPSGTTVSADGTFTTARSAEVLVPPVTPAENPVLHEGQGVSPFVQSSPPPPGPVELAGSLLSLSRFATVAVKLTCLGAPPCAGKVVLRSLGAVVARSAGRLAAQSRTAQVVALGAAAFDLPARSARMVHLTMSVSGRRLLARLHRLSGVLTIAVRTPVPTTEAITVIVLSRTGRE